MSNRGWLLDSIGDISLKDLPMPKLKAGEVLVKVKAVGICGSDIPRVYKTGAHIMPIVPGHEFSGIVDGVSEGVDPSWIGKRVAVFPKIACGKCDQCKKGNPGSCRNYDYIGSRRDGAFARYVSAPASNLLEIPDSVSFEEGAMFEPLGVAANAVRSGLQNASSGKDLTFAVCGLGTIGFMVALILRSQGYRNVFLIGNKDTQRMRAVGLGFDESNYIDAGAGDALKILKEKTYGGIDIYFECVGKNECISMGIESVAPGGRVVLVGNPYSDMYFPKDTYWKILRDQITIKGIWNAYFKQGHSIYEAVDDWHFILRKIVEGSLKPAKLISHTFSLEQTEKGLLIMRDKTEDYCKVIIVM
ncbi:MAG: galactitol-1-phosphate 5-dehydrogenase [Lachnospiraceae bacterium]|nr:galactitol-1-phosphate 5-dehydrogenase [Lachnospiraceae bacterium]